jgi:hypothetical protein
MLAVVIPSRGRPAQAAALVERIGRTSKARPLVVIDEDDPQRAGYEWLSELLIADSRNHVQAINAGAAYVLDAWGPDAVAKLDDDHWPAVVGWDDIMLSLLPGIVYSHDGHRPDLPTAPVISDAVRRISEVK